MLAFRPVLATAVLTAAIYLPSSYTTAQAQPPAGRQPTASNRNAALVYSTIFYTTPPDLLAKANEVDWTKVGFDAASLPADFVAACEAVKADSNDTVGRLIEATKLTRCDFEVPMEEGPWVQLPQLGKMRGAARLLRLDARRLAIAGQPEAAAERLAALIRLSRHSAEPPLFISSLVGVAICGLAVHEAEDALGAGKLNPAAQRTIAAALDTLDAKDPFSFKESIRSEQRWMLDWITSNFHGPDAGKKLNAGQFMMAGAVLEAPAKPAPGGTQSPATSPPPPPQPPPKAPAPPLPSPEQTAVAAIDQMNETQLAEAVKRARQYYDLMIEAWDKPDAMEQLKSIQQRGSNGEFGPVAAVFGAAAAKAKEGDARIQAQIAALRQKLAASH